MSAPGPGVLVLVLAECRYQRLVQEGQVDLGQVDELVTERAVRLGRCGAPNWAMPRQIRVGRVLPMTTATRGESSDAALVATMLSVMVLGWSGVHRIEDADNRFVVLGTDRVF